ncbi:MAG: molybdenum ABC transporter ATP-binding protein [Colwelliaceae bacterium]|jgi:molybdate transport system ATP-binding protein|nr:molybdenum ABC transporter ATP-binding protein [Colwelliaceae bacterium]
MNTLTLAIQSTNHSFPFTVNQRLSFSGIVGVFGHSGSGKTTLLRSIAGLNEKISGSIVFNDKTLFDSHSKLNMSAETRNISIVFQEPRLFPHLTVEQNLDFAVKRCTNSQLNKKDIIELTGISSLLQKNIHKLSGGEQQKVALARAVLSEPSLLLLDEPLSALDRKSKKELINLLKVVHKKLKLPMIYVSHSSEELQQLAEQLIVLEQGEVRNIGNIHQIIHQLNDTQLINQQTSLTVTVEEINHQHGLVQLRFENQKIYMSLEQLAVRHKKEHTQHKLRCYIFASDISIATKEPTSSSIVNQLKATIADIKLDHSQVLVSLKCQEQEFFASISTYSLDKLSLSIDQDVYIQFKASAVRTLTF